MTVGTEVTEPLRRCYSRADMIAGAKAFCADQFGPVKDSPDKDKWLERFGFLCSFIFEMFPEEKEKHE